MTSRRRDRAVGGLPTSRSGARETRRRWPVALTGVRACLQPWAMLWRYWKAFSQDYFGMDAMAIRGGVIIPLSELIVLPQTIESLISTTRLDTFGGEGCWKAPQSKRGNRNTRARPGSWAAPRALSHLRACSEPAPARSGSEGSSRTAPSCPSSARALARCRR